MNKIIVSGSLLFMLASCTAVPMTSSPESRKLAKDLQKHQAELQNEQCTPPSDIPNPLTYGDMQKIIINDRVSLVICQYLVEMQKVNAKHMADFISSITK